MTRALRSPILGTDALAEAKARIGEQFNIEQWNYEATRDVIRHYAWGIGDDNPLYCDPDYAAGTDWGGIIAPPTFLYSVFDAVVAPGLPDIQWIYSGADWVFHEPVRRNDLLKAKATLADVREVEGQSVSRMIIQTGKVAYENQHGKCVAEVMSHCFRIPRQSAEGGLRYPAREEQSYTIEELEAIEEANVNEFRRGSERLYFEDVAKGTNIPETVRGPLSRLDMTCYYAGAVGTSGYKSTKLKWKYHHLARTAPESLPNNYDPSYYSAAVSPSIGHQDSAIARSEIGMPGPYDNGPQRIGMMTTPVTNWIGDDSHVRSISARLKLPVIFGDTSTFGARAVAKRIEHGKGLVALDLTARNQLGQTTAVGRATVELPMKNKI